MPIASRPVRLGFVPAARGFFSTDLAAKARREAIDAMRKVGIDVVVPSDQQTNAGCVQNLKEAEACAELFRKSDVDGIVIGAGNFGDEQSAAWVIKRVARDVPILIFAAQEEAALRMGMDRRDSFCGLLSIAEGLRQLGAKYTSAPRPVVHPTEPRFAEDVDWFARVCRVVNGVRNARYGQIGARPEAFWTCRFDEKQLQRLGPTTVVLDLSEAFAGAGKIADSDADLKKLLADYREYGDVSSLPQQSVLKSAKFELFVRRWREANAIDGLAIQCWTSIQQNYGVCACATMSRLGDEGCPAACEADIVGTLTMHACQLASGSPAALADWNNLHNDDDELVNLWHCGVFPKAFAKQQPVIKVHEVFKANDMGDIAHGAVEFVAKPSPVTLSRVTQDPDGSWKILIATGKIEENAAATFGSYGWCRVANLQRLYRDVLLAHFPHHVAMTQGNVANVLWEAFGNYLGMKTYHATQESPGMWTAHLPF